MSRILSMGDGVPGQVPPRQVHPPSRYIPRQVHPPGRYTPRAGTLNPGQVHPLAGTIPRAGTPTPGRYTPSPSDGQCTGGTHPTGMQSCLCFSLPIWLAHSAKFQNIPELFYLFRRECWRFHVMDNLLLVWSCWDYIHLYSMLKLWHGWDLVIKAKGQYLSICWDFGL